MQLFVQPIWQHFNHISNLYFLKNVNLRFVQYNVLSSVAQNSKDDSVYKYLDDEDEESENIIENLTIQNIELFTTLCHNKIFKEFIEKRFSELCVCILKCLFQTK